MMEHAAGGPGRDRTSDLGIMSSGTSVSGRAGSCSLGHETVARQGLHATKRDRAEAVADVVRQDCWVGCWVTTLGGARGGYPSQPWLYRRDVAPEAEALLREALALPDGARAEIAATLLASLDAPASENCEEARRLWAEELERRARRVSSGEVAGEDWANVRQRVADELAG